MSTPSSISTEELDQIAATAVQAVLAGQFKLKALPATSVEIVHGESGEQGLSGSVDLLGLDSNGGVRLQMSVPWIESLNASLGDASPDPVSREGELLDLTGELCNMIAGRIAAGLAAAGCVCTLSTPSVVWGWRPQMKSGVKISQTRWTCANGTLTLTVWIN